MNTYVYTYNMYTYAHILYVYICTYNFQLLLRYDLQFDTLWSEGELYIIYIHIRVDRI